MDRGMEVFLQVWLILGRPPLALLTMLCVLSWGYRHTGRDHSRTRERLPLWLMRKLPAGMSLSVISSPGRLRPPRCTQLHPAAILVQPGSPSILCVQPESGANPHGDLFPRGFSGFTCGAFCGLGFCCCCWLPVEHDVVPLGADNIHPGRGVPRSSPRPACEVPTGRPAKALLRARVFSEARKAWGRRVRVGPWHCSPGSEHRGPV